MAVPIFLVITKPPETIFDFRLMIFDCPAYIIVKHDPKILSSPINLDFLSIQTGRFFRPAAGLKPEHRNLKPLIPNPILVHGIADYL
jgi:hypothetical protein